MEGRGVSGMGIADVVILTAVAVVFALCVRTIYISNRNGCSGCDSRSVCTSRLTGRCRAADDMVRRADKALGKASGHVR